MGGGCDRSPNQPGGFSIRHSGLGPDVSVQGSLPGHPHSPARPSGSHHPRAGGFWGSPAASNLQQKQPPIPGLALSCLPNPSHMVSISLGSAGACWALSELNFPLSFHAALGTGCSSFSPALVLPRAARSDTSLPAPGRVWGGRGRLLPLLCPQIAAWPCQPQVAARGGAGPGLFALPSALPQVCSPPRWDSPTGQCWGQPQNVALSPQSAPHHGWSRVWARCRGKGRDPACSSDPMAAPLTPCRLSGPLRVILIVPPCLHN